MEILLWYYSNSPITSLQTTTPYTQKCRASQLEWTNRGGSQSAKEYFFRAEPPNQPYRPEGTWGAELHHHQLATGDGSERIEPFPSNSDKDNNAWADRDEPPEYEEMIFWQPDADSDAS